MNFKICLLVCDNCCRHSLCNQNLCIHIISVQPSKNGLVSFEHFVDDGAPRNLSNPINPPLIAGFWADVSNVTIHYKEMTQNERGCKRLRFIESKKMVMDLLHLGYGCSLRSFNPTHILLVTWYNASKTEQRVSYFNVTCHKNNTLNAVFTPSIIMCVMQHCNYLCIIIHSHKTKYRSRI